MSDEETKGPEGHVEAYPCNCSGVSHICYIVRHPDMRPPISYPTEAEAEEVLERLRDNRKNRR